MADPFPYNDVPLLEEAMSRISSMKEPTTSVHEYDTPYQQSPNKAKVIVQKIINSLKSRKTAILASLVHVPPVVITIGVLTLTFRNIFWEAPSSDTNAVLNSLQFAAHIHGNLITMSISAMILHFVHRCLSNREGVPLGFLSSGFQLNSFTYLFSREFRLLNARYVGVFLAGFALVLVSGPSSAITMIPRLQFWNIDNVWIGPGKVDFSVYIQANESTLYPSLITSDSLPTECLQANASILSNCPAYGMRRWLMADEGLAFVAVSKLNKSIEEDDWTRYMVGQGPGVMQGSHSSFMASSLSNFLGKALMTYSDLLSSVSADDMGFGNFQTTIQFDSNILSRYDLSFGSIGKQIATRKPLVETECSSYAPDTKILGLPHDLFFWSSSPDFSNTQWSYPASNFAELSIDPNSDIVNSSWVSSSLFPSDQPRPSLGAIFATPETFGVQNATYSLYSCTIDARWTYTQAVLDASSGQPIVFDRNPDPNGGLITNLLDVGPVPATLPAIQISDVWSTAINPPWIDSITSPVPSNQSILDMIGQICLDSHSSLNATWYGTPFPDGLSHRIMPNPSDMQECLQVILAVYVTDALSRMQDNIPTYFVRSGRLTPMGLPPTDLFFVQDLYDGKGVEPWEVPVPWDPTSYNITSPGNISSVSKADLADPTQFTEIRMKPSQYGYGYGFQDSKLVFFGTSVLLLHVLLCIIYVAWMLGVGEYKNMGWNSLGELLSVALGSDAICLGTERGVWREKIIVQESEPEKSPVRRGMVIKRAPDDDKRTSRHTDRYMEEWMS